MNRSPQRDDASGGAGEGTRTSVADPVATDVPHLDRACELLWQDGHPRIAEHLEAEVRALAEKARRLEAVLYPRPVGDDNDENDG